MAQQYEQDNPGCEDCQMCDDSNAELKEKMLLMALYAAHEGAKNTVELFLEEEWVTKPLARLLNAESTSVVGERAETQERMQGLVKSVLKGDKEKAETHARFLELRKGSRGWW